MTIMIIDLSQFLNEVLVAYRDTLRHALLKTHFSPKTHINETLNNQ